MIVKDEETLEEALQMLWLDCPGGVRYSDTYLYIKISRPSMLEHRCKLALSRGDIAVVVPLGTEHTMEDHAIMLGKTRKGR